MGSLRPHFKFIYGGCANEKLNGQDVGFLEGVTRFEGIFRMYIMVFNEICKYFSDLTHLMALIIYPMEHKYQLLL